MFHKGKHNREKQLRFSIRKVSFGAASVAVAALFMFLGNGAVSATEQGVPSTNGETLAPQPKDQNIQNGTYEGNTVANSPAATIVSLLFKELYFSISDLADSLYLLVVFISELSKALISVNFVS